jgi:hypothetical protein
MREGGFIFHVTNGKTDPVSWDEYARVTSVGFNLYPKWSVAAALLILAREYGQISHKSFQVLWKGLTADDIAIHRQVFAMQCISTTMELIENVCAMCYAYGEAARNGPRFFPLLLRDFGKVTPKSYPNAHLSFQMDGVNNFLKGVSESPDHLREYLACRNQPSQVASERLKTIHSLRRFRLDNEIWYNKFKHSNCLLPTSALFDSPGRYSVFHMLPREVRFTDKEVVLREELTPSAFIKRFSSVLNQEVDQIRTESLFSPLQFLDDAGGVLDLLNLFWQPIKAAQHKKLFGQDLEVYKRPPP